MISTESGAKVSWLAYASMTEAAEFCAATSWLIAAASPGRAAFNAVMNGKIVVNAGVVLCAPIKTSQIGWNPSATLSLASATVSKRSHRMDQTEDSLHQQP